MAPDATEHAPIWQQITRFSTAQRQAFYRAAAILCVYPYGIVLITQAVSLLILWPAWFLPQWPIDQVLSMTPEERREALGGKVVYGFGGGPTN